MGVFMASIAFRCGDSKVWETSKDQIDSMFRGLDGLADNLCSDGPGYAIVSPYGDMGMFLSELPGRISRLVEDYAVFATCVDSDFALLELYKNGELLESCSVGEVYEEYGEFCSVNKPNIDLWTPLLIDSNDAGLLEDALMGNEVFVEDQLRQISKLTGLPIFDDALVFGC